MSRTDYVATRTAGDGSAWLLLDDLFMIHEDLAERYLGLSGSVSPIGVAIAWRLRVR